MASKPSAPRDDEGSEHDPEQSPDEGIASADDVHGKDDGKEVAEVQKSLNLAVQRFQEILWK